MIVELIFKHVCSGQFLLQLATTLTVYSIIQTSLYFWKRKKRYQLFKYYKIPGPEPRLLDGNLSLYMNVRATFEVDQKLKEQYGKYFAVFVGDEPIIVISDLELARKVFLERMSSFKDRATYFIDTPLTDSILYAKHAKWKQYRRLMSSTFSSFNIRGEASSQFIEESIRLMLGYIESKLDPETRKVHVDIHSLMQSTALHLISSLAIELPNVQVKEHEKNVESLNAFLSSVDNGIVIHAIRFPFLKRILGFIANHFEYNTVMGLIHEGLNRRIDQRVNSPKTRVSTKVSPDQSKLLIDNLIESFRRGQMTRTEVISNANATLIAGFDTISTTLAYICWTLGKYIEVQDRLRLELMTHGTESYYLEQVINETMRLYPVVITFTERTATETVVIDGLTIPKGARVNYNPWLVHRDPDYWPDPTKFDPDRFRKGIEIHPCAFTPFGLGERKCIGFRLAMLEMKMIICDILIRYRIETITPKDLELISYADLLSKPSENIVIEMETFHGMFLN